MSVRSQSTPGGQRSQSTKILLIGGSRSGSKSQTRGGERRGVIHKSYFETLTPSEIGNLRNIFERVDPGHTGFVMMDDFLYRLEKAKAIDHFLKTAYNFLMHSISSERRMGFKSFRDIIALLLPTASASRVDSIIVAGEQWADQKRDRRASMRLSSGRLSFAERIQKAARNARMSQAFEIEKESEEEEDVKQADISLSSLQELKYMFAALDRRGQGLVNVQDLERYFGTQDDIHALVHRQAKLQGAKEAKDIVLDFDGFVQLMLPKGFQACRYPDPDKVSHASSEQIFRFFHDERSSSKEAAKEAASAKEHQSVALDESHNVRPASAPGSVRPASASTIEHSASLTSLPSLIPQVPKRWNRTPLDSRTLK